MLKSPKINSAYLEEHSIDPKQILTYNFRHSAISKWL